MARLSRVPEGLLYPVSVLPGVPTSHFFRQAGPFVGWATACLVLAGIGTWAGWFALATRGSGPRRRVEVVVAAWAVLGVGVSQSEGMHSQRLAGATVLWALAAGTGVVSMAVLLDRALGAPRSSSLRSVLTGLGVLSVAALAVGGARHWFDADRQLAAYGDRRSAVAFDLGERLAGRDPSSGRVLLWDGGALSYQGFGNFRFVAPGLDGVVVAVDGSDPGDGSAAAVPRIHGEDVLVLYVEVPDGRPCAVVARYPEAEVQVARDRLGHEMYRVYRLRGEGLREGATTSGAVLTPAEATPCE
jgi:hypothetical protein